MRKIKCKTKSARIQVLGIGEFKAGVYDVSDQDYKVLINMPDFEDIEKPQSYKRGKK
jgi:penicillin V acylase-like amidase (Ntn superfamily)